MNANESSVLFNLREDDAQRAVRDLTVRIASVQADASVERERFGAERARLEAELARLQATRAGRTWPLWLAIAVCAAWSVLSTAWMSAQLGDARRASAVERRP